MFFINILFKCVVTFMYMVCCVFQATNLVNSLLKQHNKAYTTTLQTITRKNHRTEFCRTLRWKKHSKAELNIAELFTRLLNLLLRNLASFGMTTQSDFKKQITMRNSLWIDPFKRNIKNVITQMSPNCL